MHSIHRHTDACKKIARTLEERLGEPLPRTTAAAVRKHLKNCPNCTAYLDSLRKTVMLYKCIPDPRTPARVRQKLLAVLNLPY